jgi:hypothetical protein
MRSSPVPDSTSGLRYPVSSAGFMRAERPIERFSEGGYQRVARRAQEPFPRKWLLAGLHAHLQFETDLSEPGL